MARSVGVTLDSSTHGHLEYETICNNVGTRTNVERIPPVIVPKTEASALKPGETLMTLVDESTRIGFVIRATAARDAKSEPTDRNAKPTPVVQVRSHRIGR